MGLDAFWMASASVALSSCSSIGGCGGFGGSSCGFGRFGHFVLNDFGCSGHFLVEISVEAVVGGSVGIWGLGLEPTLVLCFVPHRK